jgi:single-strand DNA-binding protein
MQYSINEVHLVGRAGKDSELKTLPGGADVCEFSLATTKSFKKKGDQEWTKTTTWHNIKAFGKTAKMMSMVRKGDAVDIKGSVEQRSWDGNDGQKHYRTEVVVDFFAVLADYPKNNDNGFDQDGQAAYQTQDQGESW